jgi:Flp pilus assembly protein TadD
VLVWSGQAARAMRLLAPVSHDWGKSPAVAFAYGAALASLGRKPEATEVFHSINPRSLSFQEIAWVQAALK